MLSRLIRMALSLFTINRWNTTPHIELITEASNSGFSLHVALLLAYVSGQQVDYEKLIKRIVLKDLPKAILSDISLQTKNYIKDTSLELWNKTFKSAMEEVLREVPEDWREDFKYKIVRAKDDSVEGLIIDFSDTYAAYSECEVNARVYPEYYKKPLQELREKLNSYKAHNFIAALLDRSEYKDYLLKVRTLINAVRWNQTNRNIKTTVAGHTFFVTFISTLLSYISETLNGTCKDSSELLLKSAYHDVPEAMTGDIISPTKRRIPGFEATITKVEEQMVEEFLLSLIQGKGKEQLKGYMLHPFEGETGSLVRASDLLGSMFECQMEMMSGNANPLFKKAYREINFEIKNMNLSEVDYLLKWGVDSEYAQF
ncbi:MAG: YfbR-like 5'-deoxynucleotidase [Thermotogota bacterium]|nr:YfbR-like 5'-deoxynucleotidase [Thermotogota bacterium]